MKRANEPPKVEPWAKVTRELLRSDAWRTASINARRFVDFLLIEHMSKGGRENGRLKAPYRQLEAFGIASRYVSAAICEAERLGLVECNRQGLKVATLYRLTWLDAHAANQWRDFRNDALAPMSTPKIRNLPSEGKAGLPYKGKVDGGNLPSEGKADGPENLPYKGKALSRKDSYQGGMITTDLSVEGEHPPLSVVMGGRA